MHVRRIMGFLVTVLQSLPTVILFPWSSMLRWEVVAALATSSVKRVRSRRGQGNHGCGDGFGSGVTTTSQGMLSGELFQEFLGVPRPYSRGCGSGRVAGVLSLGVL